MHPLLLAIGSERYTPYLPAKQPAEILTIANHILGTGQLSLAKFLFITVDDTHQLSTHHINAYFKYVLERIDFTRDLHFYTKTTIDTLDYSGDGLNTGSKVVFAVYGEKLRELCTEVPPILNELPSFENARICMPGVAAMQVKSQKLKAKSGELIAELQSQLSTNNCKLSIIVLCNDAGFTSATFNNFLWVTFTRCNPAQDIYGIEEFIENKHWGCSGSLIIDARIKPHHAPVLEKNPEVKKELINYLPGEEALQGCSQLLLFA